MLAQFSNLLIKLINFAFFDVWTCHNGLMVLESFFLTRSHIDSHGVFGLVLMHHNSSG
jgi:hypothetical protein